MPISRLFGEAATPLLPWSGHARCESSLVIEVTFFSPAVTFLCLHVQLQTRPSIANCASLARCTCCAYRVIMWFRAQFAMGASWFGQADQTFNNAPKYD